MMRNSLTVILALAFGWLVGACALLPGEIDETRGWSAAKLYAEARQELSDRNYERSIKLYEKLESRYPYGRFAQQAQIELAYAHYKFDEPALAIAAADRFIKLHPDHPNVDYVYYLKGLVNFNDDLGLLGYVSGQDLSERDPKAALDAFSIEDHRFGSIRKVAALHHDDGDTETEREHEQRKHPVGKDPP